MERGWIGNVASTVDAAGLHWEKPDVILLKSKLSALVGQKHVTPYDLMGMCVADRGVVVRILLPLAKEVDGVSVYETRWPMIPLRWVNESDLFEGVAKKMNDVYAYDLETT